MKTLKLEMIRAQEKIKRVQIDGIDKCVENFDEHGCSCIYVRWHVVLRMFGLQVGLRPYAITTC